MIGINTKANDMHGFTGPGHRNFDAVDEAQAVRITSLTRLGQATQLVMIGQCKRGYATLVRAPHQFRLA